MRIDYNHLKQLPVQTASGQFLGKVANLTLDAQSQVILKYAVKSGVFKPELLIDPTQVISITAEKIVVDDAVLSAAVEAPAVNAAKVQAAAQVIKKQTE